MNTKLLFIVFILLSISEVSFANPPGDGEKHLREKIKLSSRTGSKHRSVFIAPFEVFFNSSSLSIEHDPSFNLQPYIITIKDASTNEPIIVLPAIGDTTISIEGLPFGEYTLEIERGEWLLTGTFVIDNMSLQLEE